MENGRSKINKVILTIDIGNTTVAVGVFSRNGKLLCEGKFLTHSANDSTDWQRVFRDWLQKKKVNSCDVKKIVICSVVPNVLTKIESALKTFFNLRLTTYDLRLIVVGRDIKVPMVNRYKNPKQVGQDRLVNAYSGYVQYGGLLIIVDFGTAVTFDVVSKRGEYLGGLIVPGIGIARDALAEKTVLLPKVPISAPGKMIGKTTQKSIQSGLFYGWGALTDGIAAGLKKELGKTAKVILTGGQAEAIHPFMKTSCMVNSHVTLEGLYLLSKENAFGVL